MSGWSLLAFSAIGMVAYYFWEQEREGRAGRPHDGGSGVDGGGDLKMSDFSWAPGHHHGDGGSGGHHHGGASGDFSSGDFSDGGGGGDSGSF